jgi:hypothetical protein
VLAIEQGIVFTADVFDTLSLFMGFVAGPEFDVIGALGLLAGTFFAEELVSLREEHGC